MVNMPVFTHTSIHTYFTHTYSSKLHPSYESKSYYKNTERKKTATDGTKIKTY